ncbi:MAG: histidine kinase [Halobacterium sp.]
MATETATTSTVESTLADWQRGVLAGTAGGVVFAVMLTVQMTPVIEMAIPALYGLSGGAAGWVVHVSHAAVLGVGFAVLAQAVDVRGAARSTAAGAGYGVVLWVALAVFVMPVWLQAVGFGGAPGVPNVSAQGLVGHVVYGVVLGAVYAVVGE